MAKTRRFWFGIAVSLVFLGLFLRKVDLGGALGILREANYLYLIPAVAVYFVSVYFRALRWRFLLRPLKSLSVGRLYPAVVVGYMANNLLPVRLGEVVRAYYLSRRDGVSASGSLATILVERVFDGLTLLALIAFVSLALPVLGVVQGLAEKVNFSPLVLGLAVPILFVGVAGLLIAMASFPGRTLRVAMRVLGRLPPTLISRLEPLALRFLEGLWTLKSSRRLVTLFVLSLPIWLAEAVMYLILGYSFQVHLAFETFGELVAVVLLLTAVSNLATSIPSSPGGVGPFEFFAKSTLVLMGVESVQATAYVGVLHLALLAPVTLVGLVYLRAGRLTLGRLTRGVESEAEPTQSRSTELREGG